MFIVLPYRTKIALLTLIPLIIAIIVISFLTIKQTNDLADIQAKNFEQELIALKEEELKNYLELAYTSIADVYENPILIPHYAKKEVYHTLKQMEFGRDGYFFIYDYNGVNVAHPRMPNLEGRNLIDLQDEKGRYMVKVLINQAKAGGGFSHYLWDKPSAKNIAMEKLAYSIGLDRWGWAIGTGIYIDDIEKGVVAIKEKAQTTIRNTLFLTAFIAIISILVTALIGFLINLSESKLASEKMRKLIYKTINAQEDERKRVSRELHDGINQLLVSVRYKLDSARVKLNKKNPDCLQIDSARNTIEQADDILQSSMKEVRRISLDLRPTILDDLGLSSALKSLLNDFSERTNIHVEYNNSIQEKDFSYDIETAFFRIVQEALTNIEKHAKSAKNVSLNINQRRNLICLVFSNDGIGFDKQTLDQVDPERGQGLGNMLERAELLEGTLTVNSSLKKGTTVIVRIPL